MGTLSLSLSLCCLGFFPGFFTHTHVSQNRDGRLGRALLRHVCKPAVACDLDRGGVDAERNARVGLSAERPDAARERDLLLGGQKLARRAVLVDDRERASAAMLLELPTAPHTEATVPLARRTSQYWCSARRRRTPHQSRAPGALEDRPARSVNPRENERPADERDHATYHTESPHRN